MNRIAVDVDEVLVPFVRPMAKFKKLKMPTEKCRYVYREMFEITEPQSRKMVREFYDSEAFDALQPIEYSQAVLRLMRPYVDKMYIVTGRHDCVREKTEDWLNAYFPGIFDDVILTNSFTSYEIQKYDICHSLNLDTIIDDSDTTCGVCKHWGMDAYHFAGYNGKEYEWCKKDDISVLSWVELYKKLPLKFMD